MTDPTPSPQQPEPPAVDVDTEGDDDSHDVPADLTVLHEIIEFDRLSKLGPNE